MLPVDDMAPAVIVPVPEIDPPAPVVVIPEAVRLPTALRVPPELIFPVADIDPVTDIPVLKNTAMLEMPPTVMIGLPLATGMLILLVPLEILLAELVTWRPVSDTPLPKI